MKRTVYTKTLPLLSFFFFVITSCADQYKGEEQKTNNKKTANETQKDQADLFAKKDIDTAQYNKILKALANNDSTGRWPAKAPYP